MRLTLDIHPAGPEDLAAVLSVHAAHNPEMRGTGPASPTEQATWDRMMGTDDLTVYLAENDGKATGTATMLLMPNLTYGCAPTAFIEAVVVVPELRRRGVATRILDRVLEDAKTRGCDKIQLLSHKRHAGDGGHALYKKTGFAAEAEGFRLYLQRSQPHRSPAP
jgi:GNAT superfamily N-acetyltransferase